MTGSDLVRHGGISKDEISEYVGESRSMSKRKAKEGREVGITWKWEVKNGGGGEELINLLDNRRCMAMIDPS